MIRNSEKKKKKGRFYILQIHSSRRDARRTDDVLERIIRAEKKRTAAVNDEFDFGSTDKCEIKKKKPK